MPAGRSAGVVRTEAAMAMPAGASPVGARVVGCHDRHRASVGSTPTWPGRDLIAALTSAPAPVHLVEDDEGTVYGVLVTADVEGALDPGRRKA